MPSSSSSTSSARAGATSSPRRSSSATREPTSAASCSTAPRSSVPETATRIAPISTIRSRTGRGPDAGRGERDAGACYGRRRRGARARPRRHLERLVGGPGPPRSLLAPRPRDAGVDRPPARLGELVAALLRFGGAQSEPPMLYPQTDAALLLASHHREELATAFRVVLADEVLVDELVDKDRFQALAERCGLPVPPAHRLLAHEHEPTPDPEVGFPLIVKPVVRATVPAIVHADLTGAPRPPGRRTTG